MPNKLYNLLKHETPHAYDDQEGAHYYAWHIDVEGEDVIISMTVPTWDALVIAEQAAPPPAAPVETEPKYI